MKSLLNKAGIGSLPVMVALAAILIAPCEASAKFTCQVDSIQGTTMVLKECQEKGLKRLHSGDTVSIVKKRVQKKEAVGAEQRMPCPHKLSMPAENHIT